MNFKIKTLCGGFHDRDEVLLHAAFQVLADFMEKEKPGEFDWSASSKSRYAWKELTYLYKWWKKTRPARKDPLDRKCKVPDPLFLTSKDGHIRFYKEETPERKKKYAAHFRAMKEFSRLEPNWIAEDQKNLCRLIAVRQYLWT
ncbi:MAG: hypothetical protein Q8K86_07040 [Candidatus Nanopelagicaceae bacterium]|nr:hypothetical protein [Candidatus Nanopelagicaceae bacterium]